MFKADVKIIDKTPDFKRAVLKQNAIALEKACIAVQAQAKILVRKDTGNLRDSISYKVYDGSGSLEISAPEKNAAYIGTIVVYAAYIEFTIEPYLRPSLLDNRTLIMRLIADELGKVNIQVTGI